MTTSAPSPSTTSAPTGSTDTDVLVIGSGFGGSVTALRLTEKGYRVTVVEAGRRFEDADFAKTSWRLNKFVWAPKLGLFGVQRVHLLRDVMVMAGAGVGGGSLNYANTLYKPHAPFFNDPQWAHITDWDAELSPFYDQGRRMLGVVTNPTHSHSDTIIKEVAREMGAEDTFVYTPVGVYFGEKTGGRGKPGETVPDPFFGGVGPDRTACIECGECMTGCRHGAKNTLVKNYLGLAERAGARVLDRTTVSGLRERGDGTWEVTLERSGAWTRRGKRITTVTASHVVVAAGTWGTQHLLHYAKDEGALPRLSNALGRLTRTNSESILGAMGDRYTPERDFSEGVAITSSFHPGSDTHVEPVRYGKGSNAIAVLQTLLTDGDGDGPRWRTLANELRRRPSLLFKLVNKRRWSQRTVIVLVMQNLDNSLQTFVKRFGPFRYVSSRQGHGQPNPTWIPKGNEATRRIAEKIGGVAGGTWGDIINMPMTAHFLGGCAISDSPESGVVDPYHRVWNYPTMHIVDGSAISANLGVNPALSITAQAERAMSLWPNKGEADPRPRQGEAYVRVQPVPPASPVVPEAAPGALRLPIVGVSSGGAPARV
ncbi:cholesterol oxidase [Dietzia sp. UCD-THP]|uniref:Cholesterol oxidase n=1 Tax=Dietzia natronolimnaea TaxID=161920 RepID=A0A2A2WRA6_9ACTN|nr:MULTISPECIES: GMC family oxidoreductase [Dietzia]EYT63173.1 cholesterol oxidase [Dietzia sp. UCD-THP]PAY23685.1 GMC family oxidoreductase [Dietzia natronolimnaea]